MGPAPEPIGKHSETTTPVTKKHVTAGEIILSQKSKALSGMSEYDYDVSIYSRPKSRTPSIRSSRRSSIRSGRTKAVHRRQSVETIRSLLSMASSASSSRLSCGFNRLIPEEPPSLTNIPLEILYGICNTLSTHDLLNLILVCKGLRTDLTPVLYAKPYFKSTYRLAQFVTVVSHNRHLAELVHEINLSNFARMPKDSPLAGWREWKYRSEPLYSVTFFSENEKPKISQGHPLGHPLLRKFATGGPDVPLGSLMHIVKSCSHLRYSLSFHVLRA